MKLLEKWKMDLIVKSRGEYKKVILSLLERDKDAHLLDLGCSGDGFTKAILQKVEPKQASGIDLDEANAKAAEDLGVTMWIGDLSVGLPYKWYGTFDIVIASQIIEHLGNTDMLALVIHSALKPGGYAIISTPNLAAWHNILSLIFGRQPGAVQVSDEMYPEQASPGHRRVFTKSELLKFLRFHGFTIEKVVGSSHYLFRPSIVTVKVRKCR